MYIAGPVSVVESVSCIELRSSQVRFPGVGAHSFIGCQLNVQRPTIRFMKDKKYEKA